MIIKQDFYTQFGSRPLHIYLPDDYYFSGERYPVMYFFDGHNLFVDSDATYGKSWGMKDFLDHWGKKMIVVGVECGHEGRERLSEYLPYKAYGNWYRGCKPLGDKTMQYIVNDIKPMIDANYRTWSHREATAIGGSSMGGIMALYAVVKYNSVFSKAACVSSALGSAGDRIHNDIASCSIHPDTRVWLSWGTREAGAPDDEIDCSSWAYGNNSRAEASLRARGAITQLWCQLGGNHNEESWEKQIPHFMHFLWE